MENERGQINHRMQRKQKYFGENMEPKEQKKKKTGWINNMEKESQ